MNKGIISYLGDKGFGFIKVEGIEKGIFFHASQLQNCKFDELQKGYEVTFEDTETTDRGVNAMGVNLVY